MIQGQTAMTCAMSNTGKGVIGVLALTLGAMGAAQLAFGHDVTDTVPSLSALSDTAVNREVKTDRAPRVTTALAPTQTVSVQLNGFADTTIVMRIPLTQDTRNSSSAPLLFTSDPQKHAVACEAMVSVLTDVAKQLPPGRCVT
jgi:hypothetical protein